MKLKEKKELIIATTSYDIYDNPIIFTIKDKSNGTKEISETLGGKGIINGVEKNLQKIKMAFIPKMEKIGWQFQNPFFKTTVKTEKEIKEKIEKAAVYLLEIITLWGEKEKEKMKLWQLIRKKLERNVFSYTNEPEAKRIFKTFGNINPPPLPVRYFGNKTIIKSSTVFEILSEELFKDEVERFSQLLSEEQTLKFKSQIYSILAYYLASIYDEIKETCYAKTIMFEERHIVKKFLETETGQSISSIIEEKKSIQEKLTSLQTKIRFIAFEILY